MTLFGDVDILMKLNLSSLAQAELRKFLPEKGLAKYYES
jgi:hypothetical protein